MYHKVIIVGYLGRDPEIRYLPDGQPVANFSVATNRRWTDQSGQQREETIWWRVSVFGKTAEICKQYLAKGRAVLVEGRMRADENGNPRTWTGQDGVVRASYEVTADAVRFLGRREEEAEVPPAPEAATEEPAGPEAIPF